MLCVSVPDPASYEEAKPVAQERKGQWWPLFWACCHFLLLLVMGLIRVMAELSIMQS